MNRNEPILEQYFYRVFICFHLFHSFLKPFTGRDLRVKANRFFAFICLHWFHLIVGKRLCDGILLVRYLVLL